MLLVLALEFLTLGKGLLKKRRGKFPTSGGLPFFGFRLFNLSLIQLDENSPKKVFNLTQKMLRPRKKFHFFRGGKKVLYIFVELRPCFKK